MALELDWSALDAQLTLSTTRFLSDAFSSAPRPNFLGPLTVTTFSFGDHEPSLELTDIRDIYKEFLVADEEDEDNEPFPPPPPPPPMPREHHPLPPTSGMSDIFETRSTSTRPFPFSPPQPAHHQPPSASLFSPGLLHHSFVPGGPGSPFPGGGPTSRSRSRSHSPAPFPFPHPGAAGLYTDGRGGGGAGSHSSQSHTHPHSYAPPSPTPSHSSLRPQMPSSAPSPSLQAHLRLAYTGNLSLGISTSLLINYPSPGFMTLPLSLTLTSLAFEGTLVVAFEGGKRRIHLSLLDPGPSSDVGGQSSTARTGAAGKETPGMRLLKSAVVESEVGQADKHVLKNVGKVEKFVLEVARKTIENELVFPNFQTIVF